MASLVSPCAHEHACEVISSFFNEVLIAFFLPLSLGESPSSSASDVDNLNNQATLEKVALAKGVSASQTAVSNLVITLRNRLSMQRLLQYVSYFVFFFFF